MSWKTESYIRYNASEKGRLTRKKYNESDEYKKISDSYNKSEKGKLTRKKYRDLWYKTEKGRIYSMWASAQRRALKKGIEFSIEKEDIKIPDICPLLGLKLDFKDFGTRYNSPSLDRKDPNKGYTLENIWVISSRANFLKSDSNLSELTLLVENMKKCGYT